MEKIWNILKWAISKYNLWDNFFSLVVIWRTKKHLEDEFWQSFFDFVEIKQVVSWIIYIKCKNSSWAQEISYVKSWIIQKLKKEFWERKIFDFRISF
jgi:hypothetical protein